MKSPLHQSRRLSLGKILLAELVHGGDKGLDTGDRPPAILIGLALVVAGKSIQGRKKQERKRGRNQRQQRQRGKVRRLLEHMALFNEVLQHNVGGVETE